MSAGHKYRYRARPPTAEHARWVTRLHELSRQHPRYGCRRIAVKLRGEGFAVGRKQVQRLRRAEGLRVPPPRQRQVRRGESTGLPTQADHRGHVWTWDFIADSTVHRGTLRMLTVLDEHAKEVHVLRPERQIGSADVIVKAAITEHGAPQFIRSDNGPEFIAKDLQRWLAEQNFRTIYITPASPWETASSNRFTPGSATSGSTANNCGRSQRRASSSRTSVSTTTPNARTARSATRRPRVSPRNYSPQCRALGRHCHPPHQHRLRVTLHPEQFLASPQWTKRMPFVI